MHCFISDFMTGILPILRNYFKLVAKVTEFLNWKEIKQYLIVLPKLFTDFKDGHLLLDINLRSG